MDSPLTVATGPLRIRLSTPLPASSGTMDLKVHYRGSGKCRPFTDPGCPFEHDAVLPWRGLQLPVSNEIVLRRLAAGKYAVELSIPGVGAWKSDVAVAPGGTEVVAELTSR